MATGWGNKTWGASDWGDLSDETVLVSSVAASTSIGTSTTSANANINVSGISATFSIEDVVAGASAEVSPTGIQINVVTGNEGIGIGVPVSGISSSTDIGTTTIDEEFLIGEGWGRETWGSFVWGDNYSVQLQGISLSVVTGNEDAFTDVVVAVDGNSLQTAITPVGTSANSDHEIATSFLLNQDLGTVTLEGHANVQVTNSAPLFQFTTEGNAQLSTAQAKFGTASLLLDGTDDYIETTTNLDLSSGDFTIDLWIRPDNVTGYKGIWQSGTSTTEQSYLLGNQVYWTINPSTIITTSVTVSAGVWTMLSYERQGNTHRIYKNGTLADTATTANKQDSGPFSIGENGFGDFNGYIDELRVSTVARYTGSSFTEPTSAFTPDALTSVLLHFDGANGSTTITNSAFSGTVVIGKARILPNGSEVEITIGNVTIRVNRNVLVSGNQINLATNTVDVINWNPIIPGATGIWIPIDPDNP